jgi:Cu/Ag efflux pump CusA
MISVISRNCSPGLNGTVAGEVFEGQQSFRILVRLDRLFQEIGMHCKSAY